MAPAKKEWKQCSHCGREVNSNINPLGFKVKTTGSGSMQIACPCGIMTKLCKTKEELQKVWNSRPGKLIALKGTGIKVKHPSARGMEPGTTHGGRQGDADADPKLQQAQNERPF